MFCVGSGGSCSYCDRLVVLSWVGAWRGGVVLEMCVLWLEVASYVWTYVCSEWLHVVSGRVLCVGSMCICRCVSEGVLFRMKLYIP